jgi:hypothetical protein
MTGSASGFGIRKRLLVSGGAGFLGIVKGQDCASVLRSFICPLTTRLKSRVIAASSVGSAVKKVKPRVPSLA